MRPEDEFEQLERRLLAANRAAAAALDDSPARIDQVMARGRREAGVRDVVTFGFAHLVGGFLTLLAALCRPAAEPGERGGDGR